MLTLLTAATLLVAPPPAPVVAAEPTWKIDLAHSEVTFRIRHLVSRVTGLFKTFDGTITGDPADWSKGAVEVVIQTASIDTRNERRDTHLKSADFFEVEKYPTLTFRSRSVTVSGSSLTIEGDLTIKGVTKPVVMTGEYTGVTGEGVGKQKVGFNASTKINRMDYGVSWNRAAEGGGAVLGDEVTIEIALEAVRAS